MGPTRTSGLLRQRRLIQERAGPNNASRARAEVWVAQVSVSRGDGSGVRAIVCRPEPGRYYRYPCSFKIRRVGVRHEIAHYLRLQHEIGPRLRLLGQFGEVVPIIGEIEYHL